MRASARSLGRAGRRRGALAAAALLALCAAWAPPRGFAAAPAADAAPEPGAAALNRRGALLAGALAPAAGAAGGGAAAAAAAKLQRALINVGDDKALEQEVKFWTDACKMKVLRDAVGSDGRRAAVVGFGPESQKEGGFFALEVKVDPELQRRKRPRLLNYDVMQPTVNSLNFVQIGAKGRIIDIFGAVQQAGGSSLIGDASYLDAESPRGVQVRLVPRDTASGVELISFNVEVPAFEAVSKFYQRALGFKELKYSDAEPPVQKLSAYLGSDIGGPNLLLSPVPDGRLKERQLDEFDGVLLLASSTPEVARAAEAAIAQGAEEEAAKEEDLKRQRLVAKAAGEKAPSLKKFLSGTKARPSVQVVQGTARIDDGVGDILFVTEQAEFERQLA